MYPFNVISWVKMVLVSGVMSVCLGGVFAGTRWRFWDTAWLKVYTLLRNLKLIFGIFVCVKCVMEFKK